MKFIDARLMKSRLFPQRCRIIYGWFFDKNACQKIQSWMFSAATSPDKTWKYFIISLKQSSKAVAYQRVRVFHASSLFREKTFVFQFIPNLSRVAVPSILSLTISVLNPVFVNKNHVGTEFISWSGYVFINTALRNLFIRILHKFSAVLFLKNPC